MKIKISIFVCILILFVTPILFADDYRKEIPVEEAMKAFCDTWFVVAGGTAKKHVYKKNGTYGVFYLKTSSEPDYKGTFKIEKASIDREENIYFTVTRSHKGGFGKSRKDRSWSFNKISKSGTFLEYNNYYNADDLKTKINPVSSFELTKKKAE